MQRKSWSNVPPKLLSCIGFLCKVAHKIGRLRKFNHSREIKFNFFTAWTISTKFSKLVQRAPGYNIVASDFLVFVLGLSYGLSKSKNGVKSSLNFERSYLSPKAKKIKNLRHSFVDLSFLFHSVKTVSVAINKKVKFDGVRCPFSTFLRLQGDHHCAWAQK